MNKHSQGEFGIELEDLTEFEKKLTSSAPQARDDFEQILGQQLRLEFAQRKRTNRILRPMSSRRVIKLSMRTLVFVIMMIVFGTGAVIGIGTALQQFLSYDAGLKSILEQGHGHEIGMKQTIDDFTVSLEWAYADNNRLTLAYMIAGISGAQYTELASDYYSLILRENGQVIPFIQSMNSLVQVGEHGEIISIQPSENIQVADHSLIIQTYDLSTISLQEQSWLDLRLEINTYGVTLQQRTALPIEQFEAMKEGPEEHFVFDFGIHLTDEQRVMNTAQQTTDQTITLTLKEVIVSPSQTRVIVCFVPPDSVRQWSAIPRLIIDTGEVSGSGGVRTFSDRDKTCQDFTYFTGNFDYTGTWQLEITELVGFGSGGGNDQQRIQGLWVFEFVLP